MDWVTVYDFASDTTRVRAMQKATLGPDDDIGVSVEPALVGTPEWWLAIDEGQLPRVEIEGTISKVYWGSMGDWPEFEMVADGGGRSRWERMGDVSRYAEGLRVRLAYTLHPWKRQKPSLQLGREAPITLRVELESSDKRSDPRAPGPGGIGLR